MRYSPLTLFSCRLPYFLTCRQVAYAVNEDVQLTVNQHFLALVQIGYVLSTCFRACVFINFPRIRYAVSYPYVVIGVQVGGLDDSLAQFHGGKVW